MSFLANNRVAYSAAFLRSIGAITGDMPQRRGTVIDIVPVGRRRMAKVQWDDEQEPKLVCVGNLAKVGPNSRFCQC